MKSLFSLLCVIGTLAYAGSTLTPVGRLRLLDGRTLENVVIRSYDVQASKVLVLSNGKAMLIPINLIPPPYADQVIADSARPSADLVQTTPLPATTTDQDKPVQPYTPNKPAEPSPPSPAAPTPSINPDDARAAHRAVAKAYALRYFQYEYRTGSNAITVTDSDILIDETEAVPGWNQYRTTGKAYVEFYDSVGGGSFSRRTRKFDVLTEQKPGEEIKVIDFNRKT